MRVRSEEMAGWCERRDSCRLRATSDGLRPVGASCRRGRIPALLLKVLVSSLRTVVARGEPGLMVRKGGLEPPRCYPQVPETCASTSSATFAGRSIVAAGFRSVKEPVGHRFGGSVRGRTPAPPAARLPVPLLSQGAVRL